MSPNRIFARAACALLVSVSLATPSLALAGPGANEDAKTLYDKASAKYSAADYKGAVEYFTAALEKATQEDLSYRVRGALLFNLAKSHVKAYEELDRDISHLRSARSIYKRYLDEAPASDGDYQDTAEAKSELARVETMLEEAEKKLAAERAANPGGGVDADAIRRQAQLEAERLQMLKKAGDHKTNGIVLSVVGGVFVVGGVGFLAWGSTFGPFAEEEIRLDRPVEQRDDPFNDQEQAYYDDQVRNGKIWMGVGGGAMAVGAGVVGVGVWQLLKAKKLRKQVEAGTETDPVSTIRLTPTYGRGQAGLQFGMRF